MCVIHEIHQIHSDDERGERALEAFYLASISIGGQTQMECFKIMKTEKGGWGGALTRQQSALGVTLGI